MSLKMYFRLTRVHYYFFQRQLSIIDFTLNYPPIRNNLTSANLLSMLIETDYLNYPPIRNNLTSASLISMIIETNYNFKKIAAVFFIIFLQVLFKRIHSVWNCLFIKQNAKLVQHNHLLFEKCWDYLFCSIRLSPSCNFTWLCLKAVTEPNSAEPTKLTECSPF